MATIEELRAGPGRRMKIQRFIVDAVVLFGIGKMITNGHWHEAGVVVVLVHLAHCLIDRVPPWRI